MIKAITVITIVVAMSGFVRSEEPERQYAGPERCVECHAKESESVKSHRHMRAFETLKAEGKEKFAECLPCHVTGYGKSFGFLDEIVTPELANVTCEVCHGLLYSHSDDPKDYPAPSSKKISSKICRKCHTVSQDSDFDFDEMVKTIHRKAHGSK